MPEADDDGGWKFELEDLPEEDAPEGEADDREGDEDGEGNVAGSMVLEEPLEPGSPSPENTAFVLLGAVCTVILFLVVLGVL